MSTPADTTEPLPLDEAALAELRTKHKLAIDKVLEMTTPKQKQVFRNLGVRPSFIKEYYDSLIQENERLNEKHIKAESTSTFLGWVAAISTSVTFYMVPALKRMHHESRIINAIAVGIASVISGFSTGYISTRILDYTTRKQARTLTKTAREVLTNELAVALELSSHAPAAEPAVVAEKPLSLSDRTAKTETSFVNRLAASNANAAVTPSL